MKDGRKRGILGVQLGESIIFTCIEHKKLKTVNERLSFKMKIDWGYDFVVASAFRYISIYICICIHIHTYMYLRCVRKFENDNLLFSKQTSLTHQFLSHL